MSNIRWNLTGTPNQQQIMREGFAKIHFPFHLLTQLPGKPELGWRDLNSGSYAQEIREQAEAAKGHGGANHDGEDKPHLIWGRVNGRKYVLGVIYTVSGRIYIDIRCERNPTLACVVLGAEIAHAVDFFLPMTDAMRNELLRLWGKGGTWWEVYDYGREYYIIGGEAFMHEFVEAYTDLPFGDKGSFLHDAGVEPEDVRRILGIERTDAAPKPLPGLKHYSGGPDIYHKQSHNASRKREGEPIYNLNGFRPCKVCRP